MKTPTSRRPRGNKTSKDTRDARRAQMIEKLKDGFTNQTALAADLSVSRTTIHRDLQQLLVRFKTDNGPAFEEFKRAQLQIFELMERALLEDKIDTDVAREWRGIRSEISKLLGINAESRAVVAHVSAESSPLFLKFRKASYGLTENQMEQAFVYLAALPREKPEVVMDANWFPAPEAKRLETGDE